MYILQVVSRIVVSFCCRFPILAFFRITACAVLAAVFSSPHLAIATIVRMELAYGTNKGTIDIELYDDQAPITVQNFLHYAGRGDYTNNGFIHRHATINSSGVSVLQGGGYIYGVAPPPFGVFVIRIPRLDPAIKNEFSVSRSNIRGRIAMAKLGGQPDSATSEWYINLADNSAALDDTNNSGGFTVFGEVLDTGPGTGMAVLDAISNLDLWNLTSINGALGSLPLDNFDSAAGLQPDNLVKVTRIPNVRSMRTELGTMPTFTTDVDMAFDSAGTVNTDTALVYLASFSSPPNESVHFNNGIHTMTMSGVMVSSRIVTLYDGAATRPTRYYAYGKTLDNPVDHWYDFSYDSTTRTGAEIVGDRILLHFVDGERGDDDLIANNSISHTGGQAVVTENASTQSTQAGGGCSIVTTPSQTARGGDWIMVSLFLAFVALVRRRAGNNSIITNLPLTPAFSRRERE